MARSQICESSGTEKVNLKLDLPSRKPLPGGFLYDTVLTPVIDAPPEVIWAGPDSKFIALNCNTVLPLECSGKDIKS